jgi:serine protease
MDFNDTRRSTVRPRRSIFLIAVTSFALTLTTFGIAPANATDPIPADGSWQELAENAQAPLTELNAAVADGTLQISIVRDINGEPSFSSMQLNSKVELSAALTKLDADPSVVAVDEVQKVNAFVDPLYLSSQWGLTAINASSINLANAGAGIKVAVIDTGVDASNPDLNSGQVLNGIEYLTNATYDNCAGGTADGKSDLNGHGTHVAGIISGSGIGIRGVTPAVDILPVRVLDQFGSGNSTDVACGIKWATDNGAKVINMSLGSTTQSASITAAVAYAISNNVTVVAASGNNANSVPNANATNYPAGDVGVIGVGATNPDGTWASFSTFGSFVDVSAPGVGIISTCSAPEASTGSGPSLKRTTCTTGDTYGNNYESLSGTSMASPHVAAVAAFMLSQYASLTPAQVQEILEDTSGSGNGTRINDYLGFGVVNAAAAAAEAAAVATAAAAPPAPAAPAAAAPAPAAPAAPAPAPVAAPPAAAEVIGISRVVKRKFTLTVDSPAGSKTWIQRKSGKKWVTLKKVNSKSRSVVKVSKSGTYRIQIVGPSRKVISSPFKVK